MTSLVKLLPSFNTHTCIRTRIPSVYLLPSPLPTFTPTLLLHLLNSSPLPLTDGRSKSKIMVDGKCKLLLIREETGYPSKQLCQWVTIL